MRRLVCFLISLLPFSTAAYAQFDKVMDRGFNAETTYHIGEFDSVNMLNGNLTLGIPIGQEYVSSGTLRYRFRLNYNSQFWDTWLHVEQDGNPMRWGIPQPGGVQVPSWTNRVRLSPAAPLDHNADPQAGSLTGVESFPTRTANAGLGWILSLGELEHGAVYIAPDGSHHEFFANQHQITTSANPESDSVAQLYTRDGSFLRLTKVPSGMANRYLRDVEFPDGTKQRFRCDDPVTDGVINAGWCKDFFQSVWWLESIRDPFGNTLEVTRSPDVSPHTGPPRGAWTWTFTEKANGTVVRTHQVQFEVLNVPRGEANVRWYTPYEVRVTQARLAARNGTAVYNFEYEPNAAVSTLYRNIGSGWSATFGLKWPFKLNTSGFDRKVEVSFLTGVVLPGTGGRWSFTYDHESGAPGTGRTFTSEGPAGQQFLTSDADGFLRSVTTPGQATITYTYTRRNIPSYQCEQPVGTGPYPARAVQTRTITGAGPAATWTYDSYGRIFDPNANTPGCNVPRELRTSVMDPDGNVTVNHYTIFRAGEDSNGWRADEYGLPFTRLEHDQNQDLSRRRFLSSETFACPGKSPDGVLDNGGDFSGCTALRRHYVRYARGSVDCPISAVNSISDCVAANPRLVSEMTRYLDDGDAYTTVDYEDWDGLGHFRKVTTGGNIFFKTFGREGDRKVAIRRFNPGVVYAPQVVQGAVAGESFSSGTYRGEPNAWIVDNWLLETYTDEVTIVGEDGSTSNLEARKTSSAFDHANGRLWRKRIHESTAVANDDVSRSNNDIVIEYSRVTGAADPTVVTHTEKYYGGDRMQVPSNTDLENAGLLNGLDPEYVLQTKMRLGSIKSRSYFSCDQEYLNLETNVVDGNTGLVTSSTGPGNLAVQYGYDTLGRLTSLTPPGEAAFTYGYPTPNKATMTRSSGTLTDSAEWSYDGLGRLTSEKHWLPTQSSIDPAAAGRMSLRVVSYDALGRKSTESAVVWDGERIPGETQYAYDAFGRPTSIKYVDLSGTAGSSPETVTETTFRYSGIRTAMERRLPLAAKTMYRDGLGRLVAATENDNWDSTTSNAVTYTSYRYNAGDQLVGVYNGNGRSVPLPKLPPPGDTTGRRTWFLRDGRGFLTSERHPELEAGHTIDYAEHDSRGHAGSRRGVVSVKYLYDAAERLTFVNDANGVPLKSYSYYPPGSGAGAGKVSSSVRTNRIVEPDGALASDPVNGVTPCSYDVSKSYQYNAGTGRISKITLHATKPANGCSTFNPFSGSIDYTYDTFGSVSTASYLGATLTMIREGRYLKSIPSFVSHLTYHPGGQLQTIDHWNGVQEAIALDESGLPRPYLMQISKGGVLWQHGPITYNGAGSITGIGNRSAAADHYGYDNYGRITSASVANPGSGGGAAVRQQSYGYDRWGNLTSIGGKAINVAADTNRITSGGVEYDKDGNITALPASLDGATPVQNFRYDAFNQPRRMWSDRIGRVFLYDADGERVAVLDNTTQPGTVIEQWTLRGADNAPLTDTVRTTTDKGAPVARSTRRYIYADGRLVGDVFRDQTQSTPTDMKRYYHLDHLGSFRAMTDNCGVLRMQRAFMPFGEQIGGGVEGPRCTTSEPGILDTGRLRFTGHERDDDGTADLARDFDYVHARYYSPAWGRFLSLDPAADSARPEAPQTWNRYSYASNSPINRIDRDGRSDEGFATWFVFAGNPDGQAEFHRMQATAGATAGLELARMYDPIDYAALAIDIFRGKASKFDIAAAAIPILPPFLARKLVSAIGSWGGDALTLADHVGRHGADFGARTGKAYSKEAGRFLQRAFDEGMVAKIDKDGTIRIWDKKTNTFGVYNADGSAVSLYKPDPAVHGRRTNEEYWEDQGGREVRLQR